MSLTLSIFMAFVLSCSCALGDDEFQAAGPKLSAKATPREAKEPTTKTKTAAGKAESAAAVPNLKTTDEKRQWLRGQAVKGVASPRQVRQINAQVDRLAPRQIDRMVNAVLAQQLPQVDPQQIMQLELLRAQWLRQMLEQEYWRLYGGYGAPVGYMPVITWLPQGTSFGASAVVSPDRRYVRVSPMPFFSSVGPVYNYNLNTGETTLLPQYGTPSESTYQQYPSSSSAPPVGYPIPVPQARPSAYPTSPRPGVWRPWERRR